MLLSVLGILFPVFAMLALGAALRHFGFLSEAFAAGLNKLVFYITDEDVDNEPDNRHLSFGINKPYDEETTIQDWIVMDNWRLKYYGSELLDADGIKGIESDEIKNVTTASKGIYNMLGQRLSKAQKGVNIINGKKIIKK